MDSIGKRDAIVAIGAVIALIGLSFLLDPHPTPYPELPPTCTVMHYQDVEHLTADDWAKWWWQCEERRKKP